MCSIEAPFKESFFDLELQRKTCDKIHVDFPHNLQPMKDFNSKANQKEPFLFVQFVGPIALALDLFKKQKHVKIEKKKTV